MARRAATRRTGAREVRKLKDPAKVARSVRMAVESFRGRVAPKGPPSVRQRLEDKSKAPFLARKKPVEERDE